MTSVNISNLNSYDGVKKFLDESPAIQQVLDSRNATQNKPVEVKSMSTWGLRQWICLPVAILFSPLIILSALVWAVIQVVCGKFSSRTPRSVPVPVFPQGVTRLVTTINGPNEEAKPLFNLKPIQVTERRLRRRTMSNNQIKLNQSKGMCLGEVRWFLRLYLQTRGQFSDLQTHMRALGKQFEHGGGPEAVLLQGIWTRGGKILGVREGVRDRSLKWKKNARLTLRVNEVYAQSPKALSQLNDLPIGAYKFEVPKHATAFIKLSKDLSYFFDPNTGVYEIKGEEQSKIAFMLFSDAIEGLDLRSAQKAKGKVAFCPYQLR